MCDTLSFYNTTSASCTARLSLDIEARSPHFRVALKFIPPIERRRRREMRICLPVISSKLVEPSEQPVPVSREGLWLSFHPMLAAPKCLVYQLDMPSRSLIGLVNAHEGNQGKTYASLNQMLRRAALMLRLN
jgi:hypothetical protein